METIRDLQKKSEPVFFTIDAGPQVKAVCLPAAAKTVRDALANTDGVVTTLVSGLGCGARLSERS
jgi:diphosphomevalonate decarboxylase